MLYTLVASSQSLLARTLLVSSPLMGCIIYGIIKQRYRRIRFAFWFLYVFLLSRLIADAKIQCMTGTSAWYYLSLAIQSGNIEWLDDLWTMLKPFLKSLSTNLAAILAVPLDVWPQAEMLVSSNPLLSRYPSTGYTLGP